MKIDLNQFRQTFLQESTEHIACMEAGLLDLRSAPGDVELLNAIFRSAHSIKGGAGSFGLLSLVRFTHALENLLDRLRSMELPATEQIIALLLQSVDVLRWMLEAGEESGIPAGAAELVEQIESLISHKPHAAQELTKEAQPSRSEARLYRIQFRPERELFLSGTNPLMLVRNLAALGTVHLCELHAEHLPSLADLDPALCYLSWTLEVAIAGTEADIREIFEFVEHLAEIQVERIDDTQDLELRQAKNGLALSGAFAVEVSGALIEPLEPAATSVSNPATPPLIASIENKKAGSRKTSPGGESSSLRVPTEKVDRLIDLVGELVIAHVMTQQMVEKFTPDCLPKLREAVTLMERSTRELHERVMAIRMLPVGTLFQRYTRTVYDIAQTTGKQIRLDMHGEETEIDKSMLELLGDPLTHLIRNAADHGIESAELRQAAGKPEEGKILLTACHRSGKVAIEIFDDGAGIDPERVRLKAIERGLIPAEALLTDDQLKMLIFEPGFSTREEVTDLSGRGVGMDVVKRNIQQLNGTVTLKSEKGRGSTVSIELPLTLAILEGLLVRVADRTLVLPLLSVVETVSPTPGQIVRIAEQGEVVVIREEPIPLLRLARFLGLPSTPAERVNLGGNEASAGLSTRNLVVIVESGQKKTGLVVDDLLGQQQVVVKSLERHLRKIDGLMGATILGDGCVAPIVDVAGITNMNFLSPQPAIGMASQANRHALVS